MDSTAIIPVNNVIYTDEQVALIKRTICSGATDDELQLFMVQCRRTGLDPFTRQIYFAKDKSGKVMVQATIDGLRLIASRNPEYAGQDGPYWCGPDGEWKDVWLSKDNPAAAKVGIYKHGWQKPMYGIALWREYAPYFNGKLGYVWDQRPALMLAKCAEALAIRKACPNEVSGIYTAEELKEETKVPHVVDVETGEVIESPKLVDSGAASSKRTAGKHADTIEAISDDKFEELKSINRTCGGNDRGLWELIKHTYPEVDSHNFKTTFNQEMYDNILEKVKVLDGVPANA